MQGKYSTAILIVTILAVAPACRELNPFRCPDGEQCVPVGESCGTIDCEAPTPVCKSPETETCVECTANNHCRTGEICDLQSNACVQCKQDSDCESELCLVDGACAAPEEVAYVSATTPSNPMCLKAMTCENLETALKVTPSRRYIKVIGPIMDDKPAVIDGRAIDVYGVSGATISRTDTDEVLIIRNGAQVTLVGLEIVGNNSGGKPCVLIEKMAGKPDPVVNAYGVKVHSHARDGILFSAGKLVMNDSEILDNGGVGILASVAGTTLELHHSVVARNNGTAGVVTVGATKVVVESSTIASNKGINGGLSLQATSATIVNNIIAGNGDSLTSITGGVALSAMTADIAFNTISKNAGLGLSCAARYTVTSCIFTQNGEDVADDVNGCDVNYSLTGLTGSALPGNNNRTGNPAFLDTMTLSSKMFFRIASNSAAKDKADPNYSISKDIDGEPRPATDRDIGADELP